MALVEVVSVSKAMALAARSSVAMASSASALSTTVTTVLGELMLGSPPGAAVAALGAGIRG